MPLEIKELHIKAVVAGGAVTEEAASPAQAPNAEAQEQIVRLCVSKILEILEERKER